MTDPARPPAYVQSRIVFAILAVQFIIPAISYIAAPEVTIAQLSRINAILGGGPYTVPESGHVWHMLAVGNVMTLGVMCAMLSYDLRRFYPALPALAFLKGFSSLYSLAIGASHGLPMFYAIFALDGVTTLIMIFFGRRAHRAISAPVASGASETA